MSKFAFHCGDKHPGQKQLGKEGICYTCREIGANKTRTEAGHKEYQKHPQIFRKIAKPLVSDQSLAVT